MGEIFQRLVASAARACRQRFCSYALNENQGLIQPRHRVQKGLVLGFCAKPHERFHARAVIPRPVEGHYFTGTRQVANIALEIPLPMLTFGRFGQGNHLRQTGIKRSQELLDGPALARRIATLKDDQDPQPLSNNIVLEPHQTQLQLGEFGPIKFALNRRFTPCWQEGYLEEFASGNVAKTSRSWSTRSKLRS